jgi:hypothetical protein
MERVTIKSSTIFISVGGKTSIYRSMDDVPPPLRKKLHQSTNGINAATILIADRRGREEIVRAVQGLPNSIRNRISAPPANEPKSKSAALKMDWRTWLEILLPGAVGLLIWLAFSYR